jgi:very-short-patch-repair endonuclease
MEAPHRTRSAAKRLRHTMSLPEVLLWRELKSRQLGGLHFRRQHPLGTYVLDFYCESARLAVEIDGASHGAGDAPARDARRDAWLADRGVRTLRLGARDVLSDPLAAARTILAAAQDPPPQGEVAQRAGGGFRSDRG